MGNTALSKKTSDVTKDITGTAGHMQLWQIRKGISKETKEPVSIFTFDKNDLLSKDRPGGAISDRSLQEQIYQIMLRDMQVMKESSCGGVLKIIDIVEESKTALAFIAEPVICSIADTLNSFRDIPGGISVHQDFFDNSGVVSEMEISRGLVQLVEGLQVLHTVKNRLHLNINPESVMITPEGQWKLCSFGFSLAFEIGEHSRVASPYFLNQTAASPYMRLLPDLRYCGPEMTEGGYNPPSVRYLTTAEDIFSLGVLIYELYKYNLKSAPSKSIHMSCVSLRDNSPLDHPHALQAVTMADVSFLPHQLATMVGQMIQLPSNARVSTTDVTNNPYFATGNLAVLRAIDTLAMRDVGTQGAQLLQLQHELTDFPLRLLQGVVLPTICNAANGNGALWVYVLTLLEVIAKRINNKTVFTSLTKVPLAKGLHLINPVETMQAFIRHLPFVMDTFDDVFFKEHILDGLIANSFDKNHALLKTQLICTLCGESVKRMIDPTTWLTKMIPCICKEACKNGDTGVKVHALYCLSTVFDKMDRTFMIKNILPSLKYIMDHEKHPSVSTLVVGLYSRMADQLGVDYISTAILPVLQPMLVDKALNKAQFEMVAALTKDLLIQVLDDRGRALGLGPGFHNGLSKAGLQFFDDAESVVAATRSQLEKSAPVATSSGGLGGAVGLPRGLPSGGGSNVNPFGMPPPPPTSAAPKNVHLSPVASPPSLHRPASNSSNAGIFGISPTAYGDAGPVSGALGGGGAQTGGGAFHLPSPPGSGKYDNSSNSSNSSNSTSALDPFGGGRSSGSGYQPPMNLSNMSSGNNSYQPPMTMGGLGGGGTDLASQIAQTQQQIAALQMGQSNSAMNNTNNGMTGMAPQMGGGMMGGAPMNMMGSQMQNNGMTGMAPQAPMNMMGSQMQNNGMTGMAPQAPMNMMGSQMQNNGMTGMIPQQGMGNMMGGYQAPQPSMLNSSMMSNTKKDDPFDFLN